MSETAGTYNVQEPITITPDPTGLAAKLIDAQSKSIDKITKMTDPGADPREIQKLADINSIVQLQKVVSLQGQILTELQVLNAGSSDNSTWIDEVGNYYQSIATGDTIRTYSGDGEIYIPIGKSRPADGSCATLLESATPPLSTPGFIRRRGTEQLDIKLGAKSICIIVSGGEVSCDRGEGALVAGDKLAFADPNGLSGMTLNGNPDADYLVAFRYVVEPQAVALHEPIVEAVESPVIHEEASTEDLPMTGDLLPPVHDLSLVMVEELAA